MYLDSNKVALNKAKITVFLQFFKKIYVHAILYLPARAVTLTAVAPTRVIYHRNIALQSARHRQHRAHSLCVMHKHVETTDMLRKRSVMVFLDQNI